MIGDLSLGGTRSVLGTVAQQLVARGLAPQLVVLDQGDSATGWSALPTLPVQALGVRRARSAVPALWRWLRSLPRRAVIMVFGHHVGAMVVVANLFGGRRHCVVVRCINNIWAQDGEATKVLGFRLLLPRADAVVAQSPAMARALRRRAGVPSRRLVAIANPLPAWVGEVGEADRRSVAHRWDVLWIGRLEPQKDPQLFVAAIAELARQRPALRAALLGSGSQEEALRRQIDAAGLADQVQLLGYRPALADDLTVSRCVALTSRFEGFPNVLVESLGCGVPVVAVDCPYGPAELILPGRNGVLVRNRRPEAVAAAIDRALQTTWRPEAIVASVAAHQAERVGASWWRHLQGLGVDAVPSGPVCGS